MSDMAYQGTVFGPTLWDLFFADARSAIDSAGFTETIYADDLNAYRVITSDVTDEQAFVMIRDCQSRLHRWGSANR
eukprot:931895-Alexandrium_andersonii.AAC.1